jgi:hypothetical protein
MHTAKRAKKYLVEYVFLLRYRAKTSKSANIMLNNDDYDDIDDDEPLQPLEIVKEFWGPKKGKDAMSQRLYDVRFSDGSTQAVLVEDTIDKERAVIDESFYRKVIKSWRQINPEIPKKPSAATKRKRHVN